MRSKLNNIYNNKIVVNFFHIGIIKFSNVFAKYFLVSYLIRALGEHNYGTLTWIESFIQYFVVFINFGFDIFIVKKIIEKIDDKLETDKIISTVLTLKFLLFLSSFFIMAVLLYVFDIKEFSKYFFLMLCIGIGDVFFPLWYFQGIQKMKFLSITTLIAKGVLIIGTYLFIKNPNHIFRYIYILLFSSIIYGFLGIYFLVKISKVKFLFAKKIELLKYFSDGFLFYLGKTSTLFMNFGTIFIIGKLFTKNLVSGFDLSSKIIFVFVFLFEVIQQSFFPSIVSSQDKNKLVKLLIATFILALVFNIFVYFFSAELLNLLGGQAIIKYDYLLRELSILIPIIAITTILGSCGLVAFGGIHKFNYSFLISAFLYLLSIFVSNKLGFLTFQNLVFLRISVDFIMALIIVLFSIQIGLFKGIKSKK